MVQSFLGLMLKSHIPTEFELETNPVTKISIVIKIDDYENVHFYLNFLKNNVKIELSNLDSSSLDSFVDSYKDYIVKFKNNRKKPGVLTTMLAETKIIRHLFRHKKFRTFAIFPYTGIRIYGFNNLYTFDGLNNECISMTVTRNYNTLHVIPSALSNRETVFLHNVNVEFIFSIYRNFVSQLSGIFSHFLFYFKSVVLVLYFFLGLWLQKAVINNVISNPTSISSFGFYIYLIGFPLLWWSIPRIIRYGLRRIITHYVKL